MERTATGIPGFDNLVEGGLPREAVILLSGTPGTGKTIFAIQYVYNGATQFKERGLYVTFEENRTELLEQAKQFGWNLQSMEDKGMLQVMDIPPEAITSKTAQDIVDIVKKHKIKRLVIDSISTLSMNIPTRESNSEVNEYGITHFLYAFIGILRKLKDTTSLVISQAPEEGMLASDTVSAFICSGIIHITFESLGSEYSRSLIVRKMRRTHNDEDIHPVEINKKGIIVHTLE